MNSTEKFEKSLTGALARSAEGVTVNPDAWADFQRRRELNAHVAAKGHTRRAPLLVAAAALVAVGGAAVVGQSVFDSPAYASWHSEPSRLSGDELRAAVARCGATHPVIEDRRGHHVYVLSDESSGWKSCVATLPGLSDEGLSTTYVSMTPKQARNTRVPTTAAPLVILDVKSPEGNHVKGEPSPLVYVSGRVAANVVRVDVTSSKGLISTTLKDGYFAAWWPGNDTDTAVVRAYDKSGHEIARATNLTR